MPELAKSSQILVLVDRVVCTQTGERARNSFWSQVLPEGSFQEVSIADEKKNGRPVRVNAARTVIVNWDAANGDYITGSDDVLMYFMTRKDRRDACLRARGTILCELQTGRGELQQGAYDAIFGVREVRVVEAHMPPEVTSEENREEDQWNNKRAFRFAGYKAFHPLIRDLPDILASNRQHANTPLFNFDKARPQNSFYAFKYQTSIYNCWFSRWEKGWVPLLVADLRYPWPWYKRWLSPPPAILLAKCTGGGILLASTMWIAGSGCKALVDNILQVNVDNVEKAHKWIERRRWLGDFLVGICIAFALVFLSKFFPGVRGGVLSDLGKFWSSLILFRLWLHLVRRRPVGVTILQFLHYGWQTFWETV